MLGGEGAEHVLVSNAIHYAGDSGGLAAWQSSSSFDANSIEADPGFSSALSPDFDLTASSVSSPMVDNGHPTQSAVNDLTGKTRDVNPDISAYER